MLVMWTFPMMMPTRHPLEYRSPRHGRSTRQRIHGLSSTHGRSLLHASQVTGRDHEPHGPTPGRSSRPTSRIGPDCFGDRHGYSGSPNLIASLVACIATLAAIEGSLLGHRSLVARTTKSRFHDNEATMPTYPRLEGQQGRLEALPIDDAISHHRGVEVTARDPRVPAIASYTARHRRLLPGLRRDRSRAS